MPERTAINQWEHSKRLVSAVIISVEHDSSSQSARPEILGQLLEQTCLEDFQWSPFAAPKQPRPSVTTFDELQWQPVISLETFEFEPEL